MRRSDREIKDISLIKEILQSAKVLSLALNGGDYPYIVPMNYGFDFDGKTIILYLHSAKEGKKLELIMNDNRCTFEIHTEGGLLEKGDGPCALSYLFTSLIGYANAEIIRDIEEKAQALGKIVSHVDNSDRYDNFTYTDAMLNSVCIIKLTCKSFSAKALAN